MSGNLELMRDLVEASRPGARRYINLGVGNPPPLATVAAFWRDRYRKLLNAEDAFFGICGQYGDSKGYEPLREAMVCCVNARFNWAINKSNVLITVGSQSACFYGVNGFCGLGVERRALTLPLAPEYPGARGSLLAQGPIISTLPRPVVSGEHQFVYANDLDEIERTSTPVGAYWLSRPCNPTGYVMPEADLVELFARAGRRGVPVFVDCAYAAPFPAIQVGQARLPWSEHAVFSFSLSKAGLPGERVGIVVAGAAIINELDAFQSRACIHAPRLAQAVATGAVADGSLEALCRDTVAPLYERRYRALSAALADGLGRSKWLLHEYQGGLFAWLWLPGNGLPRGELYLRLKDAGVLVACGSLFFADRRPAHTAECLRLSLTASEEDLKRAAEILANVVLGATKPRGVQP